MDKVLIGAFMGLVVALGMFILMAFFAAVFQAP